PVVLVAAEIWGLHEHIKDVTRRVAKEGYFAIANEPYYKIGELWKIEDIKQVIAGANQLPDDQMFKDLDATVAWAAKNQRAAADNEGRRRLVRRAGPGAAGNPADADRRRREAQGAGARALRRRRPRHSTGPGGKAARGAAVGRQGGEAVTDPGLRRHAARLQRRLPAELPQGSRRGRLETHAGVVQAARRRITKKEGRMRGPLLRPVRLEA